MDIVCFSHLRWGFVYQRPQHILSGIAKHFRVLFIEEPIFGAEKAYLDNRQTADQVWVVVPNLPSGLSDKESEQLQIKLLKGYFEYFHVKNFIMWYYTPMALPIGQHFNPELIIFDCMDELSAFKDAPREILAKESELLSIADLVFAGGFSLYEAKKDRHPNVYLFPSSIDKKHFEKARCAEMDLGNQRDIPYPRIGFCGVIDERMDVSLLAEMAEKRPQWQFVLIGPFLVKIDPASLPVNHNIYYLGAKTYQDLPYYFSGWDVAIMPFAMNEHTRFISPTKTPEYLAAGIPVVSTPIHDVVKSYGNNGLISIAANADGFIAAIEQVLEIENKEPWLKAVDLELSKNSWDLTCEKMLHLINVNLENKSIKKEYQHV